MMALRLDANERNLADLFYPAARPLKLNRKTVFAIALVAAAYAALGLYFAAQKFISPYSTQPSSDPITIVERWLPKPPPPASHPRQQPPPQTAAVRPVEEPLVASPVDPLPAAATDAAPPSTPVIALPTAPAGLSPSTTTGAGSATASPPTPRLIRNPDWISMPTAQQASANYPPRAARLNISGRADLLCSVLVSGAVAACEIAAELPGGYGFGAAALKMAPYFRMNPRTVDGQAIEGAKVKIPVTFNYGG